jgi:DNA-binding PadR family transcriptional regulator
MDTPSKSSIREMLQQVGEASAMDIQKETRLSTPILYTSLMQMEDEGILLSNWLEGPFPRTRVYHLANKAAQAA